MEGLIIIKRYSPIVITMADIRGISIIIITTTTRISINSKILRWTLETKSHRRCTKIINNMTSSNKM